MIDSAVSLVTIGAAKLAKSGTAPAKLADLAKKFKDMKDACDAGICEVVDKAMLSSDTREMLENAAELPSDINGAGKSDLNSCCHRHCLQLIALLSPLDAARMALEIAALFDPTGITGVAAAFSYDKCSGYFGSY